ncbi:ATP-binding cassette domain-containing protein [Ruegeria atlantica]|uniref:ATP-binding cassette domain-containing protein n=1 Tax=Ruegeria atlantica TaxID=81569 RepID=UPI00147FED7F|nr:ATP-binding cassette domain-containing protein [Ruegeria atlantica]
MTEDQLASISMTLGQALGNQAGFIGVELDQRILSEVGENTTELGWVVRSNDLSLSAIQPSRTFDRSLPFCLKLGSGRWVVVIAVDGDTALLSDPEQPGEGRPVPLGFLQAVAGKRALVLRKSLERIALEQNVETTSGHWLWSRVFSGSTPFASILAASLVANLLAAVVSLFSLQVYDRVIPNRSEDTLWVLLAGLTVAIILEAMLRIARARVMDRAGRQIDMDASADLLRHLLALKFTSSTPKASRLSQLMREFGSLREFVTEAAVGAIADLPFAVIFLLLIYWIAGPVVIVPIVGILLMIIPPFLFKRRMRRIADSALGAQTSAGRLFNEVSYGLETVKVSRAETFFADQWSDISRLIADSTLRQRALSASLTQWAGSVQQAIYALTVTASVYQVFDGKMTVGAIIATTLMTSRATSPMSRLSTVLMRWNQVSMTLKGLEAITNGPSEMAAGRKLLKRGAQPGVLDLQKVSYQFFPDEAPAIEIDSLQIKPGERIALLGPNGSGKSTLLRLISGIYSPDLGRLTLDGTDINQIDTQDYRRAVTYLSQDTVLFRGTLRDNLRLGRQDLSDEALLKAIDTVGFGDVVRAHPNGLNMQLSDGGVGLSVGQRQSVGLARMLLLDSGTVLLDEPTASLDNSLETDMIARLQSWTANRTLIVATHRMPIVSLVDRIIVLGRGQVIVDGPRQEVLAKIAAAQKAAAAPTKIRPDQGSGPSQISVMSHPDANRKVSDGV